MLYYLKWLKNRAAGSYGLLLLFAILALLSKASAITLPLSLLGLLLFHAGRNGLAHHWRSLLPMAFLALLFGVLAIGAQSHGGYLRPERLDIPLYERGILALYALAKYAVRMVLPYDLSALYTMPARIAWYHVVLGLSGLLTALAFLWKPRAVRAQKCGLLLMYAGPLIPVLQLLPFGEALMADRYGYVACLPVYFIMARAIVRFAEPSHIRQAMGRGLFAAILLLYADLSHGRAALWGNEVALFEDMVGQYPASDIPQFNLANAYRTAGRFKEAREHFTVATRLNPAYVQAWMGLGTVNAALHQNSEAIDNFSSAIKAAPGHPNIFMAYYQRARCYADEDRPGLEASDLGSAIQRQPAFAPAHYLLGRQMARAGDHTGAVEEYSKAMLLGHDQAACLLNRAISYGWLGNQDAAIMDLNKLVRLDPNEATAWFLLGIAKVRNGADGCAELQRATQLGHAQASQALAELCPPSGH